MKMMNIKKYWDDDIPSNVKAILIILLVIVKFILYFTLFFIFPIAMVVMSAVIMIIMGLIILWIVYDTTKSDIEFNRAIRKIKGK